MESLSWLAGVLYAPAETFRKIAERPKWVVALVVLSIVGVGVGTLAYQKVDQDAMREMTRHQIEERTGQRGAELETSVDQAMGISAKFAPFFPAIGLVGSLFVFLLVAVVFLLGLKLAGGELTFKQSFATTIYGFVPYSLVQSLIALPIVLSREALDPEKLQGGSLLASNLSTFAPEDAPAALVALLGSVDFFTLWSLVLLAIGYSVVARVSGKTAGVVVFIAWALWVGVKVGWAAIFS